VLSIIALVLIIGTGYRIIGVMIGGHTYQISRSIQIKLSELTDFRIVGAMIGVVGTDTCGPL
jgi:hypothetical protein